MLFTPCGMLGGMGMATGLFEFTKIIYQQTNAVIFRPGGKNKKHTAQTQPRWPVKGAIPTPDMSDATMGDIRKAFHFRRMAVNRGAETTDGLRLFGHPDDVF